MKNRLVIVVSTVLCLVAALGWQFSRNDPSNTLIKAPLESSAATVATFEPTSSVPMPLVGEDKRPINNLINADEMLKPTLFEQFQQINNEFAQNDFHQILEYHNIVTLCQGIPKTAEQRHQWQIKHNDNPDLDIELMNEQSAVCQNVPEHTFDHLVLIYRHAIKAGEVRAKLALANLMPFDSTEKFELLSESAAFSTQAIDTLAEKSLTSSSYLNPQQRLFWLSLCTFCTDYGAFYNGEHNSGSMENVLTEIKASLDSGQIEAIEQLVTQWQRATVQQRAGLVF